MSLSSALPLPTGFSNADPELMLDLLGRWLELGEIGRRAFIAMIGEVSDSATQIEQSTIDLSAHFRELASAAEAQTERVQHVSRLAKSIEVDGEALPLAEATGFVHTALVQGIDALTAVAEQAALMVHALDAVGTEVTGTEECVARIDSINKQARFVALNAAIEAERAEGTGGTFKVIANELKELSQETDNTSRMVRQRISAVSRGLREALAELQGIARMDRSAQARTRARLEAVMAGMAAQNCRLTEIVTEAQAASNEMSSTIGRLVTGTQFQDRTTQHLTHVAEALGALGEATSALQEATRAGVPTLAGKNGVDTALLERMLSRQTLSSVRQRFLAQMIEEQGGAQDADEAGGSVELF